MSKNFSNFAVAIQNDMNKLIYATIFFAAIASLSACGSSEQNKDIVVRKVKSAAKKTIQKVGDYSQSRVVEWKGTPFTIYVERKADKALSLVVDETGNKYYDNRVVVRITAKDGHDVFNRTFSKNDFSGFVDATYLRDNALLGIVFDRVDGSSLCFAASIGSPDKMSDDYVPILLKVSYGSYSVSLSKDTMRDLDEQEEDDSELQQAEEDGV